MVFIFRSFEICPGEYVRSPSATRLCEDGCVAYWDHSASS